MYCSFLFYFRSLSTVATPQNISAQVQRDCTFTGGQCALHVRSACTTSYVGLLVASNIEWFWYVPSCLADDGKLRMKEQPKC
jgi:hypothetical protein